MSDTEGIRKALLWLSLATAFLYITLLGGGIYLYYTGDKAEQVDQNTKALDTALLKIDKNTTRLNKAIGAFCEIIIAPDTDEARAIHDLAQRQLVVSAQDCEVIVRYLEENP